MHSIGDDVKFDEYVAHKGNTGIFSAEIPQIRLYTNGVAIMNNITFDMLGRTAYIQLMYAESENLIGVRGIPSKAIGLLVVQHINKNSFKFSTSGFMKKFCLSLDDKGIVELQQYRGMLVGPWPGANSSFTAIDKDVSVSENSVNKLTPSVLGIREIIRKYRQSSGLSRTEVAKRMGISYTYYSNMESGNTTIPAQRLSSLANALHIPLEVLRPNKA